MFAQSIPIKKFGLLFSGLLLGIFLLAPAAGAQDVGKLCTGADLKFGSSAGDKPCKLDDKGTTAESRANTLVADVVNIISVIVGIVAVIMIIYGGFRFVTSAGNPESTKTAKNTILYAIIGLVIVAFAQLIVKFVLNKINGG